jgi:signal peptidase II
MWLGLGLAAGVFVLDQLTKCLVLHSFGYRLYTLPPDFFPGPSEPVLPFFNIALVWNRGVSFGLLQADTAQGRWMLILVSLIVTAGLIAWLRQAATRLVALGIGLVIGGAIGNVIDRLNYHAVVDFLDFHAFGYHWYVFNIADAAIVVGVGLLILDAFFGDPSRRVD